MLRHEASYQACKTFILDKIPRFTRNDLGGRQYGQIVLGIIALAENKKGLRECETLITNFLINKVTVLPAS